MRVLNYNAFPPPPRSRGLLHALQACNGGCIPITLCFLKMLSLLALVALSSVEVCRYSDPTFGWTVAEDCSGNVNTGSCTEEYNGAIGACTPTKLNDGSMGAVKVECTESYYSYALHSNADCSDDVSTPCANFVTGVTSSCTQTYTFGTCEAVFAFGILFYYQKLTGACPGGGADSGEPSSCDGGCIGGVAGGCFVLVLVCAGWLSGAFAKIGCPPPCKKRAIAPT